MLKRLHILFGLLVVVEVVVVVVEVVVVVVVVVVVEVVVVVKVEVVVVDVVAVVVVVVFDIVVVVGEVVVIVVGHPVLNPETPWVLICLLLGRPCIRKHLPEVSQKYQVHILHTINNITCNKGIL